MATRETSSPSSPAAAPSGYYWVIVSSGFFLLLAAIGFGRFSYPILLPNMQESLGQTYGPMGLLGTINPIGYLTGAFVGGLLATRFGARVVATASIGLVGLSMIAMGLVTSYWVALVIMLLAGTGTGGVFAPTAGLARAWSPPNLGGFTMGFLYTGAAVGAALVALVIPLILTGQGQEGWRYAWIDLGAIVLTLTALGAVAYKERPRTGIPHGQAGTAASLPAWGQVFRNRTIAGLCVAYFLFGFYQVYVTFFIAYLRHALDLPAEVAGNIWLVWGILGFPFLALWGLLSDRIGRKPAMVLCMVPLVVSVVLPVLRQDIPFLYLSAILFGATFGAPMNIVLAAAVDAAPVSLAAATVGLVTAAFGLGQAVSPAMAGYLTDVTGSFYPGFTLSAVVLASCLATFVLLPLKGPVLTAPMPR